MTQRYTHGDFLCREFFSDKLENDMQARQGWCFNVLVFFFREMLEAREIVKKGA